MRDYHKIKNKQIPGKSILKSLMDPNFDPLDIEESKADADVADDTLASFTVVLNNEQKPEKKKARKSLGRRVSFAATAHVRLFDKEIEDWNTGNTPNPMHSTTFFSGADPPPDFSVHLDSNDGATASDEVTGNLFQIPDLSSVQRRNRFVRS
ncbi:hypothetical protein BC936DRAFT_147914 [Jimgerdemannia flammicorona]|uniref:Uncharacterized protein n=1 Tax=Jimgerdemannia flammicorona TaxID=994334 RepID=A0A433D449_9FUNG|nr:hypothetical protein BC936DRAFT_147914 [Jimgerdemannia flammicorona]